MNAKNLSRSLFTGSVVLLLLSLSVSSTSGQGKPEIEVKVEASSDVARGGEAFPFTITITNIGTVKADDVVLRTLESVSFFELMSGLSSKGNCVKSGYDSDEVLRCKIGDLLPGESVTIEVQSKIEEIGDRSESEEPFGPNGEMVAAPPPPPPPANRSVGESAQREDLLFKRREALSSTVDASTLSDGDGTNLASIDAYASNEHRESGNSRASLKVTVLPSRNIPPRLQIVNPTLARLKKSITRTLNVPISIKAFDPDGQITRVRVNDQKKYDEMVAANPFRRTYEGADSKYFIGDREFTAEDLNAFYMELSEKAAASAQRSGKDTFDFLWKDLRYGRNDIHFRATDNGGRVAALTLTVYVISDAEIEFVGPENNQILTPGASVKIEVLGHMKTGSKTVLKLERLKDGSFPSPFADQPFKETRRPGNRAVYSFDWRQMVEGIYNVSAVLFENGIETLRIPGPRILVREPQTIRITSFNDSQVFRDNETIPIAFEALTSKGEPSFDRFELIVDGKYIAEISNSFERIYENADPSGPPVQRIVRRNHPYQLRSLNKGTHTIQIVAKEDRGMESATLAKSEVTVVVK